MGAAFKSLLSVGTAVYPASSIADLSAVDTSLKAMEVQVQAIKDKLREETLAIPKAKVKTLSAPCPQPTPRPQTTTTTTPP